MSGNVCNFSAPVLTLIVDNGADEQRNRRLPESEAIEDCRKKAGSVELGDHMGDLRVCRGRDETRVERHDCCRAPRYSLRNETLKGDRCYEVVGGVKTRTDAVNRVEGPSSL